MSKRSDFEKNPRDYYRTFDRRAGDALAPFIQDVKYFAEPFCGAGDLTHQLQENHGKICMWKSDLEPQPDLSYGVNCKVMDFRDVWHEQIQFCEVMITNPPFTREVFHDAIEHFTGILNIDCWWLMSSDWLFNKGSAKMIDKYVTDVVAIGRMKWIPNSKMSGKDNMIWLKTSIEKDGPTRFHNNRG